MKKIIILLLICPVFLKAQKITESTYDKQDSSRVIKTNELVSNDVKVHCEYIDLQKIWFKSSNHYYSICIVFFDGGSNAVMGNDSLLKIEFTDGRIISYDKESYNIFVPFNYSNLTIKVKDSDADNILFSRAMKSIILRNSNSIYKIKVNDEMAQFIIKSLQILRAEVNGRLN